MHRDTLHGLVDRLPDQELDAARRFLEFLVASPAYRAAMAAPPDDEAVTPDDEEAMRKALDDVREGRVGSHEDVLREFGLR